MRVLRAEARPVGQRLVASNALAPEEGVHPFFLPHGSQLAIALSKGHITELSKVRVVSGKLGKPLLVELIDT